MSNNAVSFKIGADNTEAIKSLKELRDEFKSLRASLKGATTDLKIKVQVDTASIGNDIASIKNQIASQIGQIDADVKINADTSTVTSSAAAIKGQLQAALGTVDIALNLSANIASIQSDLTNIKNQISSTLGATDIKLNIDIAHLQAQLTHIRTLIQSQLSNVGSTINLNLNTGTLETTLRGTVATLIRAFRQLRDEIITLRTSLSSLGGAGSASAAQLRALQSQVHQLRQQIDQLRNSSNNASGSVNNLGRALSPLAASIKQIIAGYATLASVKAFIGVTDEAKKFEGQLKLVTQSEQGLIAVRQMLLDQSNRTGTQMASSVELYTKMYNSTRNLDGANTGLLVRVTDIVNKFVAIGGSSGESANAAIIQLSQAMASGVLRGEELNSVMEQTPGLSKALADGLGVGIGELRKMAENGELTADVVINALLKMGKTADEQFAKMPRQAAQATTALKNQVKTALADFDKQVGISATYVSILELVRENLSEIIDYVAAIGAATGITLFARQILIARDAIREKIAATIAVRNAEVARTQAMLNTARHTAAQTALELNLAKAELAAAQGATAQAAAQARLTAAKIADIQATRNLTAAQLAANTAMNAGAGAGRALLGVLGGPLGLITIIASVAAGFLLMRDNIDASTKSLRANNVAVDDAIKKYTELDTVKKRQQLVDERESLDELGTAYNNATSKLITHSYALTRHNNFTKEQALELNKLIAEYKNTGNLDRFADKINNLTWVGQKSKDQFNQLAGATRDAGNEFKKQSQFVEAISSSVNTPLDISQQVSQRAVNVDIGDSSKRLIDLKYAQESRARIVETYQIERQELVKLLDKHKSNATEQKKIKEQLYELDAKYRRELSDYDKKISDENRNNISQLSQEQFNLDKKIIEQQIKDNDQLYKDGAIKFADYAWIKNDLGKKLHLLEIGYLDQQAKTATDHERELMGLKRSNLAFEAQARTDALEKETRDFAHALDKKKQEILNSITGFNQQISDFSKSELEKSLDVITKEFNEAHKKIREIRESLISGNESINIKMVLSNGDEVNITKDILDDIENQIIDQEITVKGRITLAQRPEEIQKNIDNIMGDYDYLSRYDEIRLAMNPMSRPQVEDNKRNNAQNTLSKLKDELLELDQVYLKMLNNPDLFNADDIKSVKEQAQELVLTMGELEIVARSPLEKFKTDLQDTAIVAAESGLSDYFMDLVEGTKTANQALKDFARGFVASMAQVAAKALATYAIMQMLRLVPGGAAVAEAIGMSMTFGKAHTGKVIDGKSQNYKVDENFRLAPNEVPTILEMGEEVLTAKDPRHIDNFDMAAHITRVTPQNLNISEQVMRDPEMSKLVLNAGGQQQVETVKQPTILQLTIVNNTDLKKGVFDLLKSPEGQKVVVNDVLSENTRAINVMLNE